MVINRGRRCQREDQTRRTRLSIKLETPHQAVALALTIGQFGHVPSGLVKGDNQSRNRLSQRESARIKRGFAFDDDARVRFVGAEPHFRDVGRER